MAVVRKRVALSHDPISSLSDFSRSTQVRRADITLVSAHFASRGCSQRLCTALMDLLEGCNHDCGEKTRCIVSRPDHRSRISAVARKSDERTLRSCPRISRREGVLSGCAPPSWTCSRDATMAVVRKRVALSHDPIIGLGFQP